MHCVNSDSKKKAIFIQKMLKIIHTEAELHDFFSTQAGFVCM